MGEYKRFKADCWTVNFNFETIACITSQTDDQLRVYGTFRTNTDMVGLYWNTEDIVRHDLLSYPTDDDYSGVKLSFDFETVNWNYIGSSSLTIAHNDGNSYFVYPPRLADKKQQITENIPSNNNGNFKLANYNVLQDDLKVYDSNNNEQLGYSNININCIVDKEKNKAVFINPTKNTSLIYSTYYKSLKVTYGYNEQWSPKTLPDEDIIEETLFVTDTEDNPLSRGTWETGNQRDYVYTPNTHELQPSSQTCANGCKVYYITLSDLGDNPPLRTTLGYNEHWTRETLPDEDIIEETLVVKDLEGNILERGANDWSNPKDYVYFKSTHELQPQSERCALGCKVYYETVSDAIKYTDNVPNGLYHYNLSKKMNYNSDIDGINLGRSEIVYDHDYYLDLKQCELRLLNPTLLNGGSITYKYATGLLIDFDNLTASSYKTSEQVLVTEETKINPIGIKHILIPIVPICYTEKEYTIIENTEFSLDITNIKVTNSFLGLEPEFNLKHNYRLAEGYDDCYSLSPRRLAYMDRRLGYKEWVDFYIGASHHYEKRGIVGNNARPGVDLDKDIDKIVTDEMVLDPSTPLTPAFEIWFDDYCKWCKHYDTPNIIVSISLENLQMPNEWRQLLHDGTPGKTGWTPATKFYSPTNLDARAYIQSVAEACLDIVVNHDLTPILQWGEPWWWWQELYPEAISNDPDNQVSNIQKYPGQPPAFYDQATKDKYYDETGKQLPVYTKTTDEYDPEVIQWLNYQLVDYSNFMRSIVKSNRYENGIYTALYFPPYIFDSDRVPQMMKEVNYPKDAWNNGQLDFLQLEDYDWVIDDDSQHDEIWEFGQKLNYPNSKIHYFAGYCQYPINAKREWALIRRAAEDAIEANMAEVYLWSGTQIRRDNIIMREPIKQIPKENTKEIAIPLLNIIILTPDEQIITWLIPEIAEIEEINETNTVRKIVLSYPLEERMSEESNPWFSQGNKIFIPAVFGLTNCLYVINTNVVIDYWKDNTVTVEAEEVLTELNYQVTAIYTEKNKITKDQLKDWFGNFYAIDRIGDLNSNKNTIEAIGTTTLMTLLRTIEEKTERVFVTEYTYKDNIISRKLSLVKESSLRQTAGTEYLDLNYNLDSLELEMDEDNVYSAMAPILSLQNKTGNTASDYVNWNDSVTSNEAVTTEDSEDIYKKWLDLEVAYREHIPMIRKKEADGTVVTTSKWYAPFVKTKGKMYIENVRYANSNYNTIYPQLDGESIHEALPKIGTVTTSETDVYAIYNVLANSLLEKTNTKFKLKLSVKDISDLLGTENLGYNIYETLYVKVPGFDYYVSAYITKTTKNPHLPGNDTITVETDVKGTHLTKDTEIISKDKIVPENTKLTSVGGVLVTDDGDFIPNEMVSINIRLVEIYDEIPNITPEIKEFKPDNETYYFTDTEILELEKNLRNDSISDSLSNQYLMQDIKGDTYSVPLEWCLSIYYSFIQHYINTDYPVGDGEFINVLPVHYYKDNSEQLKKNGGVKYYPSKFYDFIQTMREYIQSLGLAWTAWKKICSNEVQSGESCVASAVSNATAFTFNYYTEKQIMELFGKTGKITTSELNTIVIPTLKKMGFNVSVVECNVDNIRKFINNRTVALLSCYARELGYSNAAEHDGHEILLYDWYAKDGIVTCRYFDSKKPVFNPGNTMYDICTDNSISSTKLIEAISVTQENGELIARLDSTKKFMIVIEQTSIQLSPDTMSKKVPVNVTDNNSPVIVAYTFTRSDVRDAWSNAVHKYFADSDDAINSLYNIMSTDGKIYKFTFYWIFGLAIQYMSYFMDNTIPKSEIEVTTGSNSSAYWYSKNKETYAHPSWEMIVNPLVYHNQNQCLISTLLFYFGELEPANNVFDDLEYNSNTNLSVSDIGEIMAHYIPDIQGDIMECTLTNIHTYLDGSRLAVVYLTRNTVKNFPDTILNSNYYDDNKEKVPVIICRYEDDLIKIYSVMHTGETIKKSGVNMFKVLNNEFLSGVVGDMIVFQFRE